MNMLQKSADCLAICEAVLFNQDENRNRKEFVLQIRHIIPSCIQGEKMFQTNLLWQNDDRWANTVLGYGPQTIKQWGCLNTSLTMVVNAYGYNETPASLNQKMTNIGAFFGSAINAYRIGEAFPGVALKNLVDC